MTESQQLQNDLQYVRSVVARRDRGAGGPAALNYIWAAYVLIGYPMIDLAPQYCGLFFLFAGILGGILSAILGKRFAHQTGEIDRETGRRAFLHFFLGIAVAVVGTFALAWVIPDLRGPRGSQVLVVMIGLIYMLAGIHFERYFLWLGPILIIGGVMITFVPHYPWTLLGIVIAVGLIIPTFFPRKPVAVEPQTAAGM